MRCLACNNFEHENLKRFSDHLKSVHHLNSQEYTIQFLCDGKRPLCPVCRQETRYESFQFKKYCKEHAKNAMIEGGKQGGKAPAWSKDKTKENDERLKKASERLTGEGNPFFGKKHSQDALEKIIASKRLNNQTLQERIFSRSPEFELVSTLEEYVSRQKQYLVFKCTKCGTEQKKTLQAFERGSRCYVCFPLGTSNWELEVFDYIRSITNDAVQKDRSLISPKELDIVVPSKRLAVECHGLYWHSEMTPDGIDPKSHWEKWKLTSQANWRLIQLFYDEWRDKPEICKSMIGHRLGISSEKINARDCEVLEIDANVARKFFEASHISGHVPFKKCLALSYENKIVAALSVRVPRQQKYKGDIEVARFATLPGFHIKAGLSRLMSHVKKWAKSEGFNNLMTYVDRRFGTGEGYKKAGFVLSGETGIDYWYTDGAIRYDRFTYRATNGKSEREIALENGVSRIYGCGSWIYLLKL